MSIAEEISPSTYGENRIDLTLAPLEDGSTPELVAFQSIIINVATDRTLPEGLVLPLEFTVTGPSGRASFQRRYFQRLIPSELIFRPIEGGSHLIRLAECFHNRWFGALELTISGSPLDRL